MSSTTAKIVNLHFFPAIEVYFYRDKYNVYPCSTEENANAQHICLINTH